MTRKTRPWLFYDTTTALCTTCLRTIEAKILVKDGAVYMDKWCPAHGMARVLVSDDADYYRLCREVYVKPPEMPQRFGTAMRHGCPYDCGLCPDHMQHSCLSIVEINEHCNLRCPICYAGSGPERSTHRPLAEVIAMLDAVVASEGEPDVVQISGGEPTLHPQFFEILDAAKARPIRHLMLNTNGLRIAQDAAFAERLAGYAPGFEVYLQFDSLRREALLDLRGADLRRVREQALERLNALDLSTTLVVTVKRGVNDDELGALIDHARRQPCVRGITFQPVQQAGRTEAYDPALHRLTVSELRWRIAEQSGMFSLDDVLPVPCNPDTLAMAYALRQPDGGLLPLTRYLDARALVEGTANTIAFERDLFGPAAGQGGASGQGADGAAGHAAFLKLFATNLGPEAQASCLSDLMCCLPQVQAPTGLDYRHVFRVLIVQFMDALSMDIRALKKSCIHFAQPDGRMIPFEAYNLFYREGQASPLAEIRAEIDRSTAGRHQAAA
ncbi:MAG: hypothetical protein RL722_1658 [Pseudomonadota bacterium]|jgi:uncharacterized radical SAM superfamily Fe-S cluster-containing enzyme